MTAHIEPADEPLWHGYSARAIDRLTRAALRLDRWSTHIDERGAAIRFGIIEHLATVEEPPSRLELLNAGKAASDAHMLAELRTHGYDRTHPERGGASSSGFVRYWEPAARTPFEERVVERVALAQVWPSLSLSQRQAVMALALSEDYEAAIGHLGVRRGTFAARLHHGRQAFAELWHEHETPRRVRRNEHSANQRAASFRGKRRLTVSEVEKLRERNLNGETLTALAAEAGCGVMTLSRLLRGLRKPAPDQEAAA